MFLVGSLGAEKKTTVDRRRQKLRATKNDLDLGDACEAVLGRV